MISNPREPYQFRKNRRFDLSDEKRLVWNGRIRRQKERNPVFEAVRQFFDESRPPPLRIISDEALLMTGFVFFRSGDAPRNVPEPAKRGGVETVEDFPDEIGRIRWLRRFRGVVLIRIVLGFRVSPVYRARKRPY